MGNFSNNDNSNEQQFFCNNDSYIEPVKIVEPVKETEDVAWDKTKNIQKTNITEKRKKKPADIRKIVKIAVIVMVALYLVNTIKSMLIINDLKDKNNNSESQSESGITENKTDDELDALLAQKVREMKVELSGSENPASEFQYKENGDGTLLISKYVGIAETVEIPAVIDGKTVCYVGREAFVDNAYLKKVILPDTVLSLDYRAFANCTNLQEVVSGRNLTSVGAKAFEKCSTLKTFNCNGNINSIRTIAGQAFFECTSLQSVNIESDVYAKVTIENDAFKNCTSLKEVNITGKRIQEIELKEGAFNGCKQLVSVPFTDKVTTLGRWVFGNCESLNNIQLPKVTSLPRATFENCKSLTSFTISNTVQGLDICVFQNCTSLKEVFFEEITMSAEEKGREIGADAFRGTAIKEIDIPGTYTHVGNYAFADCSDLTKFVWRCSNNNVLQQTFGKHVFAEALQLKEVYLSKTFQKVGDWDTRVMSNFTVYAMEGTAAQIFATEKGYSWGEWTE